MLSNAGIHAIRNTLQQCTIKPKESIYFIYPNHVVNAILFSLFFSRYESELTRKYLSSTYIFRKIEKYCLIYINNKLTRSIISLCYYTLNHDEFMTSSLMFPVFNHAQLCLRKGLTILMQF